MGVLRSKYVPESSKYLVLDLWTTNIFYAITVILFFFLILNLSQQKAMAQD